MKLTDAHILTLMKIVDPKDKATLIAAARAIALEQRKIDAYICRQVGNNLLNTMNTAFDAAVSIEIQDN